MAPEITAEFVWSHIPKRPRESNKGSFGAVLAVAGSACYRGAASLTVEGALRTGAGIVTLASVEPVLAAVSARLPECCLCPCEPGAEGGISPQSIPRILQQKATVLLIGPGLGYLAQSTARAAETRTLVKKLLTGFSGSAVLDADGLNAAASLMNAGEELPRPAKELILAPHPGEMSRLTGLSVEAVQADREGVARRYAAQWNAVVVLKGARTVVAAPDGRKGGRGTQKRDDVAHHDRSGTGQKIGKIQFSVILDSRPRQSAVKTLFHRRSPPVARMVKVSDIFW